MDSNNRYRVFSTHGKTLVRQRYLQFLRTTNKMESCKERIKCTLKQQNRCRIIRKSNKTIYKPLFKTQNSSAFQELHFFLCTTFTLQRPQEVFLSEVTPFSGRSGRFQCVYTAILAKIENYCLLTV